MICVLKAIKKVKTKRTSLEPLNGILCMLQLVSIIFQIHSTHVHWLNDFESAFFRSECYTMASGSVPIMEHMRKSSVKNFWEIFSFSKTFNFDVYFQFVGKFEMCGLGYLGNDEKREVRNVNCCDSNTVSCGF